MFLDNQSFKPRQSFLNNLQTTAELHQRLPQVKQMSVRDQREVFALSNLFDGFKLALHSSTSSLLSVFSQIKSYKTFDILLRYINSFVGDFAVRDCTHVRN